MKVCLVLAFLSSFIRIAFADDRTDNLSQEHKAWLTEDVGYIITESEEDVFLDLQTIEERDRFIYAFWRKRDPVRATPVNEFQQEHYRRLAYAEKFLARETHIPGWRTDRGRYYIILGEPAEVERFDGYNDLISSELWFYRVDSVRTGLPPFFYLLFFKRHDVGEYRLYHPIIDGPGALLRSSEVHEIQNVQAYNTLEGISPELAGASLSFDPSDPPDYVTGRASLGTDLMMARVENSPKRAIRSDYVDAYLRYGDMISTEYSFNFVPNRNFFAVLFGPQDTAFIHYSVEIDPQDFSMEINEEQNKYYTTLDVSVEVRDIDGALILRRTKEAFVELSSDVIDKIQASPFSYQDNFPIVAGHYTVNVIVRNRTLKQYTVAEREIAVEPITDSRPLLSEIVLGYGEVSFTFNEPSDDHRVFQVKGHRVQPAAGGVFAIGEKVQVFVQVRGASSSSVLQVSLLKGKEILDSSGKQLLDYGLGPIIEELSLLSLMGGNYEVLVELLDAGTVVAARKVPLIVSPRSEIPRPGTIYRRGVNPRAPGLLPLERGEQLLALKRVEEAILELETAVAANNPQLPRARWQLAGVFLRTGQADRVLELLQPIAESFPNQFEVIAGLGFAYFLKNDYASSQLHLEKAITIRPPDTTLLNILGNCYQKTGKVEKAKETLERSLEMDPNQEATRQQLDDLSNSNSSP